MARKHLIVLVGIIIVCAGAVLAEKSLSESANNLTQTGWEYGVYRVRISTYQYEWQDADRRIRAKNQTEFLEKMGFVSILNELEVITEGRLRTFEYVLDVKFLNYLGAQGWELIDVMDRGTGAIANRTFWFKRRK